jgi:hypothetical protein
VIEDVDLRIWRCTDFPDSQTREGDQDHRETASGNWARTQRDDECRDRCDRESYVIKMLTGDRNCFAGSTAGLEGHQNELEQHQPREQFHDRRDFGGSAKRRDRGDRAQAHRCRHHQDGHRRVQAIPKVQ